MSIKKIIAFGSAKGGVGKSSITASIGISLSKNNKVGILDADIYGPNQDILFDIQEKPKFENKSIKPIKKNNIDIVSMGSILDDDKAATWRGPMLSSALRQLINSTAWEDLDYLLIDMPPGTGDAYLTLFKELNVDYFILIAINNILSSSDSLRTISMLNKLNVNILGYIENNIFNNKKEELNFIKFNGIDKLGSFSFHKKIFNFDPDYNCDESNNIAKKIEKII
tara:strand:+ start:4926 stop:5600 length:675 start_codon:yes stop_codon:yes gene_type:complete